MWNFQGTSETPKRSFISAFSICMTVHLNLASMLGFPQINSFQKSVLALIFVLHEVKNVKVQIYYKSI